MSYLKENMEEPHDELLGLDFAKIWDQIIILLISDQRKYNLFLIQYAFKSTVYHLWQEKNRRHYGEAAPPTRFLIKQIDKNIRNRISSICNAYDHAYTEAMELWLSTR